MCEDTVAGRRWPRQMTATAADLQAVTIRPAAPQDSEALARLARLDSRRGLSGQVLVAEVDGIPWAAVSVRDGSAVADPFRPSGELVSLLRKRARQLRPLRPAASRRVVRRRPPAFIGRVA